MYIFFHKGWNSQSPKILLIGNPTFFMTVKSKCENQYFNVQKFMFMGMIIINKRGGGEGNLCSPSHLPFDYHYQYKSLRNILSICD